MNELARETLEQIAGYVHDDRDDIEFVRITTVARELLALRESVDILVETSDEHCDRLDALEHQARPLQEGGELSAAERYTADRWHALRVRAETAERELARLRDELKRMGGVL